jgi:hypothetical protein
MMHLSSETKRTLIRVAFELILYAVLVVVYLFLVLTFFGPELVALFKRDLVLYAGLALGLMVFQGFFLESVTTFLIDRLGL